MSADDDALDTAVQVSPGHVDRDGIDIARRLVTTVAVLAVLGTIVALVLVRQCVISLVENRQHYVASHTQPYY